MNVQYRSLETDAIELGCDEVVADICSMNWSGLGAADLVDSAWIYYYFSIQFRENLEIALKLYPDDKLLVALDAGERNTDNLSPCSGVATPGEKMNHDEFMRRALDLEPVDDARRRRLRAIGESYLARVRVMSDEGRARSLASYEDGGLESVFRAILRARVWSGPLLHAYKHFLDGHIALDSDEEHGHGALCRHLKPTEEVRELWLAFRDSLIAGVPSLDKRA